MFALLKHTTRQGAHWDLLVEAPGCELLTTWRLAADPCEAQAPIAAERIADHRRVYLEYEGEISGGRGVVARIDRGEAELLEEIPTRTLLSLVGVKLHGRFEIAEADGSSVFRAIE